MKRLTCILVVLLLLIGCGQKVISPVAETVEATHAPAVTALPTSMPTSEPATPAPTATPLPVLPTFAPAKAAQARFPEELLSLEGDPICSEVRSLLLLSSVSLERFNEIIRHIDALDESLQRLAEEGRTLTAERKEKTAAALTGLMGDDMLSALRDAYAKCPGGGTELPVSGLTAAVEMFLRHMEGTEDRTIPFFALGPAAAREYVSVLARYMGEPIRVDDVFAALEAAAETDAIALSAALQADPEAARKKHPISFGSLERDMAFLTAFTQTLYPLPDGAALLYALYEQKGQGDMDLLQLAERFYPGRAFLQAYAAHASEEQRGRWANAPMGYLKGLAIHNAQTIIPDLEEFGLDYVQYRWYEEMLYQALTGITALQIHYYGYTKEDIADYLKSWGAEGFADYLYEKAMADPFDSVVAVYGYSRYLEICQAALDAGCDSEERFLRDYMAAGPAPFEALKEYMVSQYQKQG